MPRKEFHKKPALIYDTVLPSSFFGKAFERTFPIVFCKPEDDVFDALAVSFYMNFLY